jgi:hypothetical protein
MINWKERSKAAGIHLSAGLVVAVVTAFAVFGLWYPDPYWELSGGKELFLILLSVDVALGPLSTFAVFDLRKTWPVMRRDLAVIVSIQLVALGYGLWTLAVARPVHLVFEINQFRVVHAVEIPRELASKAPPGIPAKPWTGPTLIAVRPFANAQEKFEATLADVQGLPPAARPDFWQDYAAAKFQVLLAAKPAAELEQRFPRQASDIRQAIERAGRQPGQVLYLPVVGRKVFWTALVDGKSAEVIALLPIDSF